MKTKPESFACGQCSPSQAILTPGGTAVWEERGPHLSPRSTRLSVHHQGSLSRAAALSLPAGGGFRGGWAAVAPSSGQARAWPEGSPGCSRRGSPQGNSPAARLRCQSARRTRPQSRSWQPGPRARPRSPGSHTAWQSRSRTWRPAQSRPVSTGGARATQGGPVGSQRDKQMSLKTP